MMLENLGEKWCVLENNSKIVCIWWIVVYIKIIKGEGLIFEMLLGKLKSFVIF